MRGLLILLAVAVAAAAAGGAKKDFKNGPCANNKRIKAVAGKIGEEPEKCAVVDDVTVVASTTIDPNSYGNPQGGLDGVGVLTDNSKEYPNTDEKPKPKFTVTIPGEAGICGIIIGGRTDYDNDYVEEFEFEATSDDEHWFKARDDEGHYKFKGNAKGSDTNAIFFAFPIPAKKFVVTATHIMDGAAASGRFAAIVNCEYKNTYDLGDTCEFTLGSKEKFPKFSDIPMCTKLRMQCRAGACTMLRPSWGGDPYSYDSPVCYNIQLYYTSLGDGNFCCWRIGKWNTFEGIERGPLLSMPFNAEPDGGYEAYTCDFDRYLEICKGKKKT